MGALQKVYELFSKVGDLKIMLVPVVFMLAVIGGFWGTLSQHVELSVIWIATILILNGSGALFYVRAIRPKKTTDAGAAPVVNPAAVNEE